MFMLEVNMRAVRDSEKPSVRYVVEQKRGSDWVRDKVVDVTAGQPDTRRELLINDDERVVIEPVVQDNIVYNREEMAAVPAAANPQLAPNTPPVEPAPPVTMTETRVAPTLPPAPHQSVGSTTPIKPGEQGNTEQLSRDQVKPLVKPGEPTQTAGQKPQPSPLPGQQMKPTAQPADHSPSGQGARDSQQVKGDKK